VRGIAMSVFVCLHNDVALPPPWPSPPLPLSPPAYFNGGPGVIPRKFFEIKGARR